MTDRPLRIGLTFHSTRSDNLGVGALTVSEIEILRDIGRELGRELAITVFDWRDTRTPYVTGDDVSVRDLDRRAMLDPRAFLAGARRADLMIDIGGGDSFADIYGSKRIRMMLMLRLMTHAVGTPLVAAPQTVGPFTRPLSRRLARATLRRSAIVATRDALSTRAAIELGVPEARVIEASDVALRLPWDPPAPRAPGGPVRVGINVSALLMRGGYTGRNEFGLTSDYPGLIRALIAHFRDHPAGCETHLVPHVLPDTDARTHVEDDFAASRVLAEEFPHLVLAPRFATPSEAKTYVAGMDFFMGARMHACIAAFSSGVPVVPMAYSRKFAGLFGTLGYDRTVDCTTEGNDAILGKIVAAFEGRDVLEAERAAALERGQAKLTRYRDALRDLMATL